MRLYRKLTKADAKEIIESYDSLNDIQFDDLIDHWKSHDVLEDDFPEFYRKLRKELLSTFDETITESGGKITYLLDLKIGLKLYKLLPLGENFTYIQANDDDIWRYLSVKVMPDITYARYPKPEKGAIRLNRKRFYEATRRIWLKTLWWYIYLSWQGTETLTYKVLKDNGVDDINKLIETPGRGYRIGLYRALIYEYYVTRPHQNFNKFAPIAKLNNAKCISIEPALTKNGEKGYAERLLAELDQKGDKADAK